MKNPIRVRALVAALSILCWDVAKAGPAPVDEAEASELKAARAVFEANLNAIRNRDRAAYLAVYLDSERLVRTGPAGPSLGYSAFAKEAGTGWPDSFNADDLRLTRVAPGVVYGTYRYRVRYGAEEHAGLSERIFLKTKSGWKIAVTTAFDAPAGAPPPPRAIVGATLFDGTGAPPIPNSAIVMRDGKIECVATRAACPVPEGVEVTDATGLWITPGLVDAHVHFAQTGWADGRPDALDVRARHPYEDVQAGLKKEPERFLRSYACSGVTAVFDVGGFAWTLGVPARAAALAWAPHVRAAGPLLSTVDHWLNLPAERQFMHLKDEESGRLGVRYLATQGAQAVKVWYIVNPERTVESSSAAVAAAGDEARKKNLPLIVHATGLAEAKAALRAGARLLVHSVWDVPVDQEFLDLARQNTTVYCPTLTVMRGYVRMAESAVSKKPPTVDDPNGCVDAGTLAKLAETATIETGAPTPKQLEDRAARTAQREAVAAANLKRVSDAGIPIAMGTDAGNPLTLHGPSVYAEMEAMQAAGLSPAGVLTAATRGGSQALGLDREIGTIEKGKIADLLIVDADPSLDIANLRKVKSVVRGGAVRSIEELRAAVAAGK